MKIPGNEALWTQKEAAAFVHMGVSTLRASDCPKLVIQMSGQRRPMIRYVPSHVRRWLVSRTINRTDAPAKQESTAA